MAYTNSPLVTYTKLSPNHSGQRTHGIDRITPHCYVGQQSAPDMGAWFATVGAQCSCNYGIGKDGDVGLFVEEKNRSWCSSSSANDQRAITIECASDSASPYAFRDVVYQKLIALCTDICRRNGKTKLLWIGNKDKALAYDQKSDEMLLTVHRWFANKECVPVDSEVLTRSGWVKLSEIEVGDEIACADLENLKITFEEVYDKVPERIQDTYTSNGFTATKDHKVVFSYQQSKTFYRIDTYNRCLHDGTQVYIPMAGYSDNEGLPVSDNMLAFYVAVQADGHYMRDGASFYGLEFHLKKERKIEKIKSILETANLEYRETNQSDGTTKIRVYNQDGINIVSDICEKYLCEKNFTWTWINLSPKQARFVLDEILFWDGCEASKLYSSTRHENLDIVSAIAALNGVGSNVTGDNIVFRENPYMTLGEPKRNRSVKARTVSCVSVKTGIFLCRQNGKTFITGNCPGAWMYSRMGDLAEKVTAALSQDPARTYTVQCGVFSKKANAAALADRIRSATIKDPIWMGWVKRESGAAGFRQTNGDKGHAYGKYQFDYRYALVPFLQDCVAYNPERYAGLQTWAQMKQSDARLVNNAFLAEQWTFYCDHYPEEFEALQDRYAYMWYYLPVKRILYEKTGINLDDRPPAVKGTLFSMSIRSGAQSAAAAVSKCSPKTSDKDLLHAAYTSYGMQDAGRWLMIGQYGDALDALRSGEHTDIDTGVEVGFDAIVKKAGKNYLVQAGSFQQKANAEKLVQMLKENGFDAIIK